MSLKNLPIKFVLAFTLTFSLILLINFSALNAQLPFPQMKPETEFECPPPVLSRLQTHQVQAGETIASIARQYNLQPDTIINFQPYLKTKPLTVGENLTIPPLDGWQVEVPLEVEWEDIAEAYGVRPDVLFELNGCTKKRQNIFVPGLDWRAIAKKNQPSHLLSYYPLPENSIIGLKYGWQSKNQHTFFHTGVDFLAPLGTKVLAGEDGMVVFVGQEPKYGFLVIIHHEQGKQTRYAHLSRVNVKIEEKVVAGTTIGQVGQTGTPDLSESHLHFEVRIQTPQGWISQNPLSNLSLNP